MNLTDPKHRARLAAYLVGFSLMGANSFATLLDQGATTLDTSTGLEWLDVQATEGLSYDELVAGAGGWYAAGYRHATAAEVLAFWSEAGFGTGTWVGPAPQAFAVGDYLALTSSYDPIPGDIPGGTAPEAAQFGNYAPAGADRPVAGILLDEEIPLANVKLPADLGSYSTAIQIRKGNFLVRLPVPEVAATAWLAVISFAALAVSRRGASRTATVR